MLFINLKQKNIVKQFNFHTVNIETKLQQEVAVLELKKIANELFTGAIKKDAVAVDYVVRLNEENTDPDTFVSIVNVLVAEFFRVMTTDVDRKTDYRLDVPDKLKNVKMSYSALKKACNKETINDMFNLTIIYGDLTYILCDERTLAEPQEFVHSVEEMEKDNA